MPVSVEALSNMIGARRENLVQCVVLNACYSASEALVLLKHVPYVVASRSAIKDEAAIAFAVGFYNSLGAGEDVGEAFNAGLALIQAQLSGLKQHQIPVLLPG